jgi:hypothetical protein
MRATNFRQTESTNNGGTIMTDTSEPNAIKAHLDATTALIQPCLEQVKAKDRAAFDGALIAIQNGAVVEVTTRLSTTGFSVVDIALVNPEGERLPLAHVGFDQ